MSRIIKPQFYISLDDKLQINVAEIAIPKPAVHHSDDDGSKEADEQELQELLRMKDQILQDAESAAEQQIREAMEESAALRDETRSDIDKWWQERREQDDQAVDEARKLGYEKGYQEGLQQAEEKVLQQCESLIGEARAVLEQAYDMKRQIIQESEPFLIELSTAIAQKIIQHELSANPEWVIGMTRSILARKREKGIITLCVSPNQFAYIRDARDELMHSVDSQAELQILPDSSVGDYGCVVRTAFGSVDARVDTQLKEIKQALQQLSMEPVEGDEEE